MGKLVELERSVSEGRRGALEFPVRQGQKPGGVENFQTTLRNRIGCAGIGLHSGEQVRFTIYPAEADSGIIFRRMDLRGAKGLAGENICVQARYDTVSNTQLGSTLANEAGVSVATVEHLMSAFSGCGIDNARVDLDGPELPVLDGSAVPFVVLLECAGVSRLTARRRYIRILDTVSVSEDGKRVSLSPHDGFVLDFEIDFPASIIGRQAYVFQSGPGQYKTEIAPSRTFGFLHEAEHLKSLGLARGGSLQNAIVLDGENVLNEGGLRFPDEFVRHKILDAMGDLYLAGAPIIGRFDAVRAGHALNNKLLRTLFNTPNAWEYVEWPVGAERQTGAAPQRNLRRAARG
ncbi:MAG: UDP-3-O-acyl-N-acetylglucosamine deacetylase [Alphaproteobacteria bacterium]|nr:UDP-3-O-acyl-N-acetylglucosamine deacetylase [Alphaproteobacteria bacterium]